MSNLPSGDRRKQILFQLLEGETLSRRSLANTFKVTEKTIQRDMETLRNWRWPIESNNDGYYLRQASSAEKFPYPDQFLALLMLTHSTVDQTMPIVLPEQKNQLKRKLLKIPELDELKADSLTDTIKLHQQPIDEDTLAMLGKIIKAILGNQALQFHYTPLMQNKGLERKVVPLQLRERDNCWYLCGYDLYFNSVRTYSIPRIKEISFMTFTEKVPSKEELYKLIANENFGVWLNGQSNETHQVKVKFTKDAARLIQERCYHDSQQIEVVSRDEVIATFEVDELLGIKLWLRSFITQAEILSPPSLRKEMIGNLRMALAIYKN